MQQDHDGSTPLRYVASCGELRMTQLLHGAYSDSKPYSNHDIEEAADDRLISLPHVALICDEKGYSPIHTAAVMGYVDVIKEILGSRPDSFDLYDKKDRSFLHIAVKYKRIEIVKYVLESDDLKRMLINQQDKNGNSALHLAVRYRNLEIIRLLVKDRNLPMMVCRNFDGLTPLDLATSNIKYSQMEHGNQKQLY